MYRSTEDKTCIFSFLSQTMVGQVDHATLPIFTSSIQENAMAIQDSTYIHKQTLGVGRKFRMYFSVIFTACSIGNVFPLPTLLTCLQPYIKTYDIKRRELCCFIYRYQIFLLRLIAYPEFAYIRMKRGIPLKLLKVSFYSSALSTSPLMFRIT